MDASFDAERFAKDLQFIGRERNVDRAHYQAVQDLCARVFTDAGFAVERVPFAWAGGEGTNVVGTRAGQSTTASTVVVGAHYDHIDGCDGADDNASGTAAVLELARALGPRPTPATLIVACWDDEEDGLRGSDAHAQALVEAGQDVALAVSLDSIAYANPREQSQSMPPGLELIFPREIAKVRSRNMRADFIGVLFDHAAATAGRRFEAWAETLELPIMAVDIPTQVRLIDATAQLRRSDHASFWRRDIPAVLVNDTANFRTPTYHCWQAPDTFDTLDLDFAFKVTRATGGAVLDVLQGPPAPTGD